LFNHIIFNFVLRDLSEWEDLVVPTGRNVRLDDLAPRFKTGKDIWIVQTFQALRARGYPVQLTAGLDDNAINILHYDDMDLCQPSSCRYFTVSIRADRDPAFVSQVEIVQNRFSVWSSRDIFIPHWPQPGLMRRLSQRECLVKNVVYIGKEDNLNSSFRTSAFHEKLQDLGMKLEIRTSNWWDYRLCDVVLAVRSGPSFYLSIKPASKLINAWQAGCPAILSAEPGYQELRQSKLDYFEANDPESVLCLLDRLKKYSKLYSEMVINGQKRAIEFSQENVCNQWQAVLNGIIWQRFNSWKVSSSVKRYNLYWLALFKKRVWGWNATGDRKSSLRETLQLFRRGVIFPRSLPRYWPRTDR
jgi:hypothetical protein